MNLRTPLAIAALSLATLALASCTSSSKKADGLNQVDDLLGRIERVYVECELADARVREAMETLNDLTAESLGDPMEAHLALAAAVERSQMQAEELQNSIAPMKASGEALFERWNKDLEAFRSESMRARSAERLAETRVRYDAIVQSVEPVAEQIDGLNAVLADSVLFLGNDLNAGSLAALRSDVEQMLDHADEINDQLEVCLAAAEDYMRSASLPEGLGAAEEPAPKPKAKPKAKAKATTSAAAQG